MGLTYKGAGVDIEAGADLIDRIKPLARAATRPEVLTGIGGFAGMCRIPTGYTNPIMVSGTDGVGTKLKVAFATGRHRTIGVDLVAMCVNDVAVVGAEPLFFLDYFGTGVLDPAVGEDVVAGIADGCRDAGCALLGGETAELPGMYADGEYDLAGFCVGIAEHDEIRDGRDLAAGDVLLALASSGVHSNGLSLARKALLDVLGLSFDDPPDTLAGATIADELLRPTRIYAGAMAALERRFKGAAHITGGGLIENPPRMLRDDKLALRLDPAAWPVPPIFDLIASAGVELDEIRTRQRRRDRSRHRRSAPKTARRRPTHELRVMRFAVLVSGSGTNLQALLDAEARGELAPAEVALVLSNRPGAGALERAKSAGKTAVVVDHKLYLDRAAFERALLEHTDAHGIEAIVLAGFMRVLTDTFVESWAGRIVNTHPSLLPAFPGIHGAQQALDYGVKVTGCTIHFVDTSLDGGPIIAQAIVPVHDDDDAAALQQRIQTEEHVLLPKVAKLLAQGRLQRDGRRVRTASR